MDGRWAMSSECDCCETPLRGAWLAGWLASWVVGRRGGGAGEGEGEGVSEHECECEWA